jgi:hypothetical protein
MPAAKYLNGDLEISLPKNADSLKNFIELKESRKQPTKY